MKTSKLVTLLTLAAMSASAAPISRLWDVDVAAAPRTAQFSAYRGETVEFEARLRNGAWPFELPATATASLHVSTNGVDYWCWPASATTGGVVRATWLPYYDCGADAYRCFIRVADGGSNVIYRANFLLRLLGSPGEWPAGLPPPVRLIDFDEVAVTNAPWATPAQVESAIASIDFPDEADPLFAEWAATNRIADAISNAVPGDYATVSNRAMSALQSFTETDPNVPAWAKAAQKPSYAYGEISGTPDLSGKADAADVPGLVSNTVTKAYVEGLGIEAGLTDESDPVWAAEKGGYATSSALADVARDTSIIYQLVVASNVVMEVTNYNSRVHATTLRLLNLNPTNGYIIVWAETNGLARTLAAATNHAMSAVAAEKARADAAYAPRAWSRTTSGLGADSPSNTTWISTARMVLAGGYEYAKVATTAGEAWVLCSNGMAAGGDTNAYFRIASLDGEPLIGIEKTDDLLIGVAASDITVAGNVVSIPLDVVSATAPICYATDSLSNPDWTDLSDSANWPAWVSAASATGSAGNWKWEITTSARSAFFQFRVAQQGTTVIRHYAPTDLSQGLLINGTRFYPHVSGGTLTWTTTP